VAPPSKAVAAKDRDQDRRKTILRAAVEVFARKGYHGCRIADVAREANVAYGLVYHYFRNKDELLQLVFETGWGGFVARIREAAEGTAPLDAKLRRIFQVAFDGYRVDPRGVRVLVLEFARGPGTGEANRRSVFETGWGGFVARIREAAAGPASLDAKVKRIFKVAFDGYRVDPRGVRVLVLEFARGPGTGEANRRGAFAEVLDITRSMFERARLKGELRPELDPSLCAAMLFGAVEMGLTSLVLGLLDGRDEALLARAQSQLADSFLHGTLAGEATWKQDRSGSRLKTTKRP
jgi:TetR/AcrR family fatty acid metabolism transcriptional regulator